jgi:lipopolysaccharide transport system permease protein
MHLALNLYSNRDLIRQFALREVRARYKGTYLGMFWTLLYPLMMLGVYTFAFGVILNARFGPDPNEGKVFFALNLFCGLILYDVFSGSVTRAPSLIISHSNYVTKVVFPLEILPVALLMANLINTLLGLAILVPAVLVFVPSISKTIYMFPLVFLPLCALSLGLSWFLASLGVFLRDIGQTVGVLVQLLFFLSPIIFPAAAAPSIIRPFLRLNPFTTILEDARATLIFGQPIQWYYWAVVSVCSLLIMQFGYVWFMKSKRAFADVL